LKFSVAMKRKKGSVAPVRASRKCNKGKVDAIKGFHPKTDKYKVVHIWRRRVGGVNNREFERVVLEIHTLGTPSWCTTLDQI